MKTKIDITKQNRDFLYLKGQSLWFEQESDNLYTIHSTEDYILEYCTVNYDELPSDAIVFDNKYTDHNGIAHTCKIHSFDPSGGPYMQIGEYKINGKTLKRIFYKDNKVYFEVE